MVYVTPLLPPPPPHWDPNSSSLQNKLKSRHKEVISWLKNMLQALKTKYGPKTAPKCLVHTPKANKTRLAFKSFKRIEKTLKIFVNLSQARQVARP